MTVEHIEELDELLKPSNKPTREWAVICPTVNDALATGENRSAVAVCITDGAEIVELVRVGLVRRNSKNPDVEFVAQLQVEVDKANEIVATVNEHLQYLEELRAEAAAYTRKHVASIVGKASSVPV